MYEWSKLLMEKIENAKCLNERDLRVVEVALRLYDIQEMILDEAIAWMPLPKQYEGDV